MAFSCEYQEIDRQYDEEKGGEEGYNPILKRFFENPSILKACGKEVVAIADGELDNTHDLHLGGTQSELLFDNIESDDCSSPPSKRARLDVNSGEPDDEDQESRRNRTLILV